MRSTSPLRISSRALLFLLWMVAFLSAQDKAADPSNASAQQIPAVQGGQPPSAAPATPPDQPTAQPNSVQNAFISGVVKSGNTPLPGATVRATNTLTGEKVVTATDIDGTFSLQVPSNGRWVIRSEMAAFAPSTQEAVITATVRQARVNLESTLASRSQQLKGNQQLQALSNTIRGFQSLSLVQGDSSGSDSGGGSVVPQGISVPGMSSSTATESVAVSGGNATPNFSNMSSEELQQRFQDRRDQGGFGGGGGGLGGGGGRGGGGGGGGIGSFFGRGGRLDLNRPHGSVYYTAGTDAVSAEPYALRGHGTQPSYVQNRFGGNLGGPLNIPKIYNGGSKTFFFVNFNGTHNTDPYDNFATVPTLLERQGNFSQATTSSFVGGQQMTSPVQLYNGCAPSTPPPCTQLDPTRITPAAHSLLAYIPLPNVSGAVTQNFHFTESVADSSDDLNARVIHSLGGSLPTPSAHGPMKPPNNTLTFGFHYHRSHTTITDPFPTESGATEVRSFDIPVGYIRSFGKVTNIATIDYNRNRTQTRNLYADRQNIIGAAGIDGVSQEPFDWGLPNISLTHFTSINDVAPVLRRDQTLTLSDNMIWTRGKHALHWGGDFRRIQINTHTDNNSRGTFIFTGCNTSTSASSNCSTASTNSGYDFADFLLGLPQQTSVQFGLPSQGQGNYHFRGNSWDAYVSDEWRFRGNLTFNLGLRYEYVSPFVELNDRIANIDANSSFSAVATVLPNGTGPFQGKFTRSLLNPDRNNFAPRIGLAWKAKDKTVVRAGYGINYNTTAYSGIILQLASQPPFAVNQTNIEGTNGQPTLQQGFCPAPTVDCSGITNNYGVSPNYRVGYVQIWNVDVQQEIRPTLILNLDYTGTKGTRLDIVDAPNRLVTGIRLKNVDSFDYEASLGDSTAEVGSVRLRKRLQAGLSVGGTYTWSKSLDNASTIGGGAIVVAQDSTNLHAERGLSSFDQRHKFSGNFLYEFPIGHERRWLTTNGIGRDILGDWQWSGDWTIASGTPFTPRLLGDFSDVNRGTNGTLRPNAVLGQSVEISHPTVGHWFNTSAFSVPAPDSYGGARRNSIPGPRDIVFNMAMTKVFPLKENRVFELRAQASNVFNHPDFTGLDTTVNSPTFGRVTTVGTMRTIQFTARLRF